MCVCVTHKSVLRLIEEDSAKAAARATCFYKMVHAPINPCTHYGLTRCITTTYRTFSTPRALSNQTSWWWRSPQSGLSRAPTPFPPPLQLPMPPPPHDTVPRPAPEKRRGLFHLARQLLSRPCSSRSRMPASRTGSMSKSFPLPRSASPASSSRPTTRYIRVK